MVTYTAELFLGSIICVLKPATQLVILSHEFFKLPHGRDRRKKSLSGSPSIGGENRWPSIKPGTKIPEHPETRKKKIIKKIIIKIIIIIIIIIIIN